MSTQRSLLAGAVFVALLACVPTASSALETMFVVDSGSPFSVGTNPREVVTADFNGDGKADIATSNINGSNISVLLGDGSGGFTQAEGSPFAATHPGPLAVGDFNGDGHPDLVALDDEPLIANQSGLPDQALVLLGNGEGRFGSPIRTTIGPQPTAVAVGDFNEDGNSDIAITNTIFGATTYSNEIDLYLGDGAGGFAIGSTGSIVDRTHSYP